MFYQNLQDTLKEYEKLLDDWEKSQEHARKSKPIRPAENWEEYHKNSLTHIHYYTEEQVYTPYF